MASAAQVKTVLELAGIRNLRESPEGFSCACPYHGDRHASMAVNVPKQVFVCYSARCGASGPLWDLLQDLLGWSKDRARDYLGPMRGNPGYVEVAEGPVEPPFNQSILSVFRSKCPEYLLRRGFDKKTLREWEIGYDESHQCAVIPVRDAAGTLVGLTKRTIFEDKHPKYTHLYFRKGDYLFGENRVDKAKTLYVTEGTLSPVKAWQFGLRNVVSTNGSKVSRNQLSLLAKYEKIILVMDGDRDGVAATETIGRALFRKLGPGAIRVCANFTQGLKDLDEEIDRGDPYTLITTHQSYEEWVFNRPKMGSTRETQNGIRSGS